MISRRTILRGAGAALALPFLESFGPRFAKAGTMPTRFVVVTTGQGTLLDRWTPPVRSADALELSELLTPLSAHREKLVVVSGIDNPLPRYHESNGHNAAGHTLLSASLCTTSASSDGSLLPDGTRSEVGQGTLCIGPSIDHYLADRIGAGVPLNLAVNGTSVGENRMYYRVTPEISSSPNGARAEARLRDNPRDVFDELLAGRSSGSTPTPSLRDRLRGQRGRVLDSVAGAYGDLSRRVSSPDRVRLEAHAERLRDLESRLDGFDPIPVTCDPSLAVDVAYPRPDAWYKAQIDVLVQTLACGVTRVATLHDSQYHGPDFAFLQEPIPPRLASMGAMPLPGGAISDWHAQVHGESGGAPNENQNLIAGFTFYATQVAYLLDRMNAIIEPDGNTLLDNSVVLWISEFGDGGIHSPEDLPVVLAGSAGGRLVTGRHLARDTYTTNDLYASILNLFDVPDRSFGLNIDGIGHGGVPGLV